MANESAAKFTPGPWTVESNEAVCLRAPDGGRVCSVHWLKGRGGLGGRRNSEEVHANARLIAAAPDLFLAILNSDDAHWTPKMRSALAKVIGEY